MAKLEHTFNGDFYSIIKTLSDGIINGSISASLEDCIMYHKKYGNEKGVRI